MKRFISMDPLGYVDSMNMYESFGCDPVNNVDPLGLKIITNNEIDALLGKYALSRNQYLKNKWGRKYEYVMDKSDNIEFECFIQKLLHYMLASKKEFVFADASGIEAFIELFQTQSLEWEDLIELFDFFYEPYVRIIYTNAQRTPGVYKDSLENWALDMADLPFKKRPIIIYEKILDPDTNYTLQIPNEVKASSSDFHYKLVCIQAGYKLKDDSFLQLGFEKYQGNYSSYYLNFYNNPKRPRVKIKYDHKHAKEVDGEIIKAELRDKAYFLATPLSDLGIVEDIDGSTKFVVIDYQQLTLARGKVWLHGSDGTIEYYFDDSLNQKPFKVNFFTSRAHKHPVGFTKIHEY